MRLVLAALLLFSLSAFAEESTPTSVEKAAESVTLPVDAKTDVKADAKVEAKAESEIPLNLEAVKKTGEESHPFFKFLLGISLMGVVGTGAYFFVRKYSKKNYALNKHNQIRVLTQHYLGPKKSLAIIRVAGESILVGITDHNISMIKSLSLLDDEVPEMTADDFPGLIQQDEGADDNGANFRMSAEDEEFSIRGIKDVVSKRLKGMRSFQ
jgi:flagellar protein FliO/FliZ